MRAEEAWEALQEVELETTLLVLAAPLLLLAFAVLFVAGAVNDWRSHGAL